MLARRLATVAIQKPVKLILPRTDLRLGLPLAFAGERCLIGSENLADSVPRHMQLAANPLERPSLHMEGAPNPGNRIHRLHPHTIRSPRRADGRKSHQGGQNWTPIPRLMGSILHADSQTFEPFEHRGDPAPCFGRARQPGQVHRRSRKANGKAEMGHVGRLLFLR